MMLMDRYRPVAGVALAAALAGCATRAKLDAAPDLEVEAGAPAPPQAHLYADCIAGAIRDGRLDAVRQGETRLLRFTCAGAPAAAFFAALAPWSARIGSEWSRDGRLWRSTAKVRHDLFGVDYCSARADGTDAACAVTLNVGGFLGE
jgi:hypothetical protein